MGVYIWKEGTPTSYDIADIISGTATLPSESVDELIINFEVTNMSRDTLYFGGGAYSALFRIVFHTSGIYVYSLINGNYATIIDINPGGWGYTKIGGTMYFNFSMDNYEVDLMFDDETPYNSSGTLQGATLETAVPSGFSPSGGATLNGTVSMITGVGELNLKNAYIGEYRVPGENTIAYYPLDTDFNDASGNGYNLTNNGAVIQTKAGVECAYFNGSSYATNSSAQNGTTRTLCAWVYIELSKTQDMGLICTGNTGDSFVGIGINQGKGYITDWWIHNENGTISVLNGWHLIGGVITNGGNMVLYTDGVQNASYTYSRQSGTSITLGARTGSWSEKLTGWMSRVIVENGGWTQQDFQNYYNSTKSNYGL